MPPREIKDRRTLAEAAFGMWSERADIDETWLDRGRARWKSDWAGEWLAECSRLTGCVSLSGH